MGACGLGVGPSGEHQGLHSPSPTPTNLQNSGSVEEQALPRSLLLGRRPAMRKCYILITLILLSAATQAVAVDHDDVRL